MAKVLSIFVSASLRSYPLGASVSPWNAHMQAVRGVHRDCFLLSGGQCPTATKRWEWGRQVPGLDGFSRLQDNIGCVSRIQYAQDRTEWR